MIFLFIPSNKHWPWPGVPKLEAWGEEDSVIMTCFGFEWFQRSVPACYYPFPRMSGRMFKKNKTHLTTHWRKLTHPLSRQWVLVWWDDIHQWKIYGSGILYPFGFSLLDREILNHCRNHNLKFKQLRFYIFKTIRSNKPFLITIGTENN